MYSNLFSKSILLLITIDVAIIGNTKHVKLQHIPVVSIKSPYQFIQIAIFIDY